jgi:hypothetical protein
MLYIGYHDSWRVEIELLYSVIRPEGKEARSGAIESYAFYVLQGWDRVPSNMPCSYVPRKRLSDNQVSTRTATKNKRPRA